MTTYDQVGRTRNKTGFVRALSATVRATADVGAAREGIIDGDARTADTASPVGRRPALSRDWPPGTVLGQLAEHTRDALVTLGRPAVYAARQTIIRQGDHGGHAFLLLKGCVKVVVNTTFGRDVLIAVRGAGDLFGEMAVLEHQIRSANVIAGSPVHARLIRAAQLADFIEHRPDVSLAIATVLSERLRSADHHRVDLVACPAPARVGRVLDEVLTRHGKPTPGGWLLGIPLNQVEIASLAGVSLSTVEKTLHVLQRDGVLRRQQRRIVVTDVRRLRRFSGSTEDNPY
jgi:CRP-like cAMP-binding protein